MQGKDGYPIYRRRNDQKTVEVRNAHLNNQWVVPYNPYLLTRYNCHINVKICSGVQAVKYLYKYIYKGHDRVAVHIAHNDGNNIVDEIKTFQDARWVSSQEALWRIFEFNLNEIHPAVINLQLHLPNKQFITYWANQDLRKVIAWDHITKTMLTEYFTMCRNDPKAKAYLYREFPEHYVWNKKDRCWYERKQREVIGRVNGAHPAEGERYYLRLLLNHVRGPTSFEDLLTIDCVRSSTFKEAAQRRGLLESDKSISECLNEAITFSMPYALRRLFATILVHCEPTDVRKLWNSYFDALSEDFKRGNFKCRGGKLGESIQAKTLKSIKFFLESMGKKLTDYDLPQLSRQHKDKSNSDPREIQDEMAVEIPEDDTNAEKNLNPEQQKAFSAILDRVKSGNGGVFFVDGPGGTGKTYLYRAMLSHV
ncbi:hypothetical protein LIER_30830 [Lithospermum erythrorhizon]|uniref:ATP-dependent DNA helicase n=1 Tax=Lithospermum erythrorhizon TaxID=34254 RepID=A0AAV3RSN6_LITER